MSDPLPKSPLVGSLLGLAAHDLRNPLSALRSNLGYLESALRPDDEDTQEALSDALVSCDSLLRIIDNLDLLGRTLRGDTVALASMPAHGIIQDVIVQNTALAKSHETSINFDAGSVPESTWVESERQALAAALSNLIRNGIQHGGRGPVRVSISLEGDDFIIAVRDPGEAIPDEAWETATSAVGQLAAKKQSAARYGYGFGLYAALAAATAAGATLGHGAEPGGGSLMFLKLKCSKE